MASRPSSAFIRSAVMSRKAKVATTGPKVPVAKARACSGVSTKGSLPGSGTRYTATARPIITAMPNTKIAIITRWLTGRGGGARRHSTRKPIRYWVPIRALTTIRRQRRSGE